MEINPRTAGIQTVNISPTIPNFGNASEKTMQATNNRNSNKNGCLFAAEELVPSDCKG
jgi:hypothetical protein